MNSKNNQNEINVGVDTGKTQLDIYIRPLDIYFSVTNDDEGIEKAVKKLEKYNPTRIVIEATGRLEHGFIVACAKAKLPFTVANPIHVKKFAGAIGRLAKTDKLDAELIAHFSEAIKPPQSKLKPENIRIMSDLVSRRSQLLTIQTMEKNRVQIMPKEITQFIKPILTVLKKQLDKIEEKMMKIIDNCDEYKAKSDIIQSMPGAGKVIAVSLISNFPELGYLSNKQAAALVGVAPINKESGKYEGKRKIRGGRSQIRTVMYMGMMSGIRFNPVFKAFYQKLLAQGKAKKTAIIACIRKMIVILNSMVRDGVMWDPKMN
jgi:transposase